MKGTLELRALALESGLTLMHRGPLVRMPPVTSSCRPGAKAGNGKGSSILTVLWQGEPAGLPRLAHSRGIRAHELRSLHGPLSFSPSQGQFLHTNQPTQRPEKPSSPAGGGSVCLGSFWSGRPALNRGTLEIILYLEKHWFIYRLFSCLGTDPGQLAFPISCPSFASPYQL